MVFETWNKGQHLISEKCRKIWELCVILIRNKDWKRTPKSWNMKIWVLQNYMVVDNAVSYYINLINFSANYFCLFKPQYRFCLGWIHYKNFGAFMSKDFPGILSLFNALYSQVLLWACSGWCCWWQRGHQQWSNMYEESPRIDISSLQVTLFLLLQPNFLTFKQHRNWIHLSYITSVSLNHNINWFTWYFCYTNPQKCYLYSFIFS